MGTAKDRPNLGDIAREGRVIHDPSGRDYTSTPFSETSVDVLVQPYEPDPDELLRRWQESAAGASD